MLQFVSYENSISDFDEQLIDRLSKLFTESVDSVFYVSLVSVEVDFFECFCKGRNVIGVVSSN